MFERTGTQNIRTGRKCSQFPGWRQLCVYKDKIISIHFRVSEAKVHNIVNEDLNFSEVCAKIAPRELSDKQKDSQMF